jgi:hypothetical protein
MGAAAGPFYSWSGYAEPPPGSNLGADPLGLRSVANRIARDLVPGLTQSTQATRGFSLVALGLGVARKANGPHRDEAYLRFERMWVLAQVARHRSGFPFPGVVRAQALLARTPKDAAVPLDQKLLADELGSGGWGAYRKASVAFSMLESESNRRTSHPVGMKAASPGERLAGALRRDSAFAHTRLGRYIEDGEVPRTVLAKLGAAERAPSQDEVSILGQQMAEFDEVHGGALGQLATVWEQEQALSLVTLNRHAGALPPRQREALQGARALRYLMRKVERPYRHWVASKTAVTIGPVRSAAWRAVSRWDLDDHVARLADVVTGTAPRSAVEGIHRHQAEVASLRGAEPWQPGDPRLERLRFRYPDFTLRAVAGLLSDGVDPRDG